MFHPPPTFLCTLHAAVAGERVLGVPQAAWAGSGGATTPELGCQPQLPQAQCTGHKHLTVPQHTSARQQKATLTKLFMPLFH